MLFCFFVCFSAFFFLQFSREEERWGHSKKTGTKADELTDSVSGFFMAVPSSLSFPFWRFGGTLVNGLRGALAEAKVGRRGG